MMCYFSSVTVFKVRKSHNMCVNNGLPLCNLRCKCKYKKLCNQILEERLQILIIMWYHGHLMLEVDLPLQILIAPMR